MTDFGRVGRLTTKDGWSVFMVVAPSEEPIIRAKVKDWRWTLCLLGTGWWGDHQIIRPGEFIPVRIDDPRIEWLDD